MIKKTNLLILILGVLLASCFKPEEIPPLEFNGKANMTIAEFQTLHELSATKPVTFIERDAIITGLVISTDQFGSSYKEIYFQDETGGLSIRINNSSYYEKYRIGQRIFVKAQGLYLGNYVSGTNYGFYQIADYGNANGGMEYLSASKENLHIFRSGIPETPPAPKIITKQTDFNLPEDYHTLVQLKNCYFADAKDTTLYFDFSSTSNTISRRIRFNTGSGNGVDARISRYCDFANDTLPEGPLNITGILTKFYDDTPQLIICSIKDVEKMPEEKILKNYDMYTDPFTQGWTNKQIQGIATWNYSSGTPGNVRIQPQAGNETECWFVSPKFNFAGEKDIALFFSYRIPNGSKDNVKVAYTIDGTNWHELNFIPEIGPTTDAAIKIPDNIATNPNLQIAFQYKTTGLYPIWMISGITIKGNVGK